PRIQSELELQARWFAGDFGKHFVSTTGDRIDIVQFGTWNRETGPDFRDAAIRINGGDPAGRFCSREKLASALLDENVQHSLVECRIGRVTVCLPAAIDHIELDAAVNRA